MAKAIKITEDMLNEMREDFELALAHDKMDNGKFRFEKSFNDLNRECTVYFDERAYTKMMLLIYKYDKEVAWNGLAKRYETEDGSDAYFIYDIIVYPQTVTSTNVDVDIEEEVAWKDSLPDEVFNNIRFQGHSHVNMGTSPSSTDRELYKGYLNQCGNEDFYIFMICNKKGEITTIVYDLKSNIMYEDDDVRVIVFEEEGGGIMGFLEDAEEKVCIKTYSYQSSYKSNTAKKDNDQKWKSYSPAVIFDDETEEDDIYEVDEYTNRWINKRYGGYGYY